MPEMIEITKAEYEELIACRNKLWALEGAGVDNWDGFDYAMSNIIEDD